PRVTRSIRTALRIVPVVCSRACDRAARVGVSSPAAAQASPATTTTGRRSYERFPGHGHDARGEPRALRWPRERTQVSTEVRPEDRAMPQRPLRTYEGDAARWQRL